MTPRRLPTVQSPSPGRGDPITEVEREGWELRFTASLGRAEEMADLYRSLGFETRLEQAPPQADPGCTACFGSSSEPQFWIYTRESEAMDVNSTHVQDPTAVLRDEHQRILSVAGALETLLDTGVEGPDALDTIGRCVDFFRLFADACHHGKEEDLLFPALTDLGMARDEGPIAVMLEEHRVGRAFVARMAGALPGTAAGDAGAARELEEAGRGYVTLIRSHIFKEDYILFEMADQIMTAPGCARLCAAYDGTCDHTFDGHTKAELERLATTILGEVGPPKSDPHTLR